MGIHGRVRACALHGMPCVGQRFLRLRVSTVQRAMWRIGTDCVCRTGGVAALRPHFGHSHSIANYRKADIGSIIAEPRLRSREPPVAPQHEPHHRLLFRSLLQSQC
jgi:hypothetical protein